MAKYTEEMHKAHVARVEAQQRKKERDSRERLAKAGFLAAGGEEAQWESTWEELDKEERKRRIEANARAAREMMSEHSRI
jgi:hypothetical protein